MLELALPDHQYLPVHAAEAAEVPAVVGDVPRELVGPELPVAFFLGGAPMGAVGG
jgi:hypothetical protein